MLEQKLKESERELHKRNISRVMNEMEIISKLAPGSDTRAVEGDIESWRLAFIAARKLGIAIPPQTEKMRKELELTAFERNAEHALKEFSDFVECRPSRFASKGSLYGWNAYYDALLEQSNLPVQIVWALETPNAARIYQEYDHIKSMFSMKFFANGPIHGMGGMRNYGDVCGKEREKNQNTPAK